jgi:hypothetical protein
MQVRVGGTLLALMILFMSLTLFVQCCCSSTTVNSIISTFVAAVEAGQQHQHALMQVRVGGILFCGYVFYMMLIFLIIFRWCVAAVMQSVCHVGKFKGHWQQNAQHVAFCCWLVLFAAVRLVKCNRFSALVPSPCCFLQLLASLLDVLRTILRCRLAKSPAMMRVTAA